MYSAVNGTVNEWEGKPTGYVLNLKLASEEVEKLKKLATELIENAKKTQNLKVLVVQKFQLISGCLQIS